MEGKNLTNQPIGVKIHPLTLLSIVDHHERTVGNKKNRRAVGALLGEDVNGVYEVTNSFAIPFDESPKGEGIWYVDHNYHEIMFAMFKKINIKEKVLGWYVTGTTFRKHDIEINELFAKYTENPILIVVDVKNKNSLELPTKAFYSEMTVSDKGFITRIFKNTACNVSAFEPEEVGVEHLVREIKDLNMDSLQNKLALKVNSLLALDQKVETIILYLEDVIAGKRKKDPQILRCLQEILSKLPKLLSEEFKKLMSAKINDNYLNIYVSSIVKGIINIHNLLNNRIRAQEEEKLLEEQKKSEEEAKVKAKEVEAEST